MHIHLQPVRQGVDHRGTHAMQTAGHLIAAGTEFAAGVKDSVHDLQRRLARLLLNVHGNTTAIVRDLDHIALFDDHLNGVTIAGQCLVDGIVNNFIHQMMQTGCGCRSDIHTRAHTDGLQTLQHLNFRCVIFLCYFFIKICHLSFSKDLYKDLYVNPPCQCGGGWLAEYDCAVRADDEGAGNIIGGIFHHAVFFVFAEHIPGQI